MVFLVGLMLVRDRSLQVRREVWTTPHAKSTGRSRIARRSPSDRCIRMTPRVPGTASSGHCQPADATFEAASSKGYETLFAFVRAAKSPVLSIYLQHGYSTIGTACRHAQIDGRFIDEILIERLLTGVAPQSELGPVAA